MPDAKITALPAATTIVLTDLVPMVSDPGGTPVTQKMTLAQLATAVGTVAGAGALSIAGPNAVTSPVNLTTQGTVDWMAPLGNTAAWSRQDYPNRKMYPTDVGFLDHKWIWGPGLALFTGALLTGVSATAADNMQQYALTNYATGGLGFWSAAGAVNYGFYLLCHAGTTSRTLKMLSRIWSGVLTVTAHLSDGSAADVSATMDSGAGAGMEQEFVITFNAGRPDAVLTVTALVTTNHGSQPHTGLVYATLN